MRLWKYLSARAIAHDLTAAGYPVSEDVVQRWKKQGTVDPRAADRLIELLGLDTTKEAAPPDWAERLAEMAAEAAVTRLVPPDLLEQVPGLFQRIEAFLQQVAEDAPEEPGPPSPGESAPLGRTDE